MRTMLPSSRSRRLAVVAAVLLLGSGVGGCAGAEAADVGDAHAVEAPGEDRGPSTPAPESTIAAPAEGGLRLPSGYRLAVVVPQDDEVAAVLLDAVSGFAARQRALVEVVPVDSSGFDDVADGVEAALAQDPDVVVGLGASAVDAFSMVSSQALDREFVLLGAQFAEPTANATSVIWAGSTSRGSAAAPDDELDAASVTTEQGEAAIEAGLASVLDGVTGVVIALATADAAG